MAYGLSKPYPGISIDHLQRSIHSRESVDRNGAAHMQNVRRVTVADTVGGLWASSGPCGNTPRPQPGTNCDFIIITADLSLRPSFFFLLQHRREVLACLMATRPSVPPSNASRIAMSLRYRETQLSPP